MDFLANEIKWGGHQFYFGRVIIWYGKKSFWFWQSIAWVSEGELSLVKVIITFSFDFDTRPTEIQNAPIEFWKGLNWLGRNIDWLGKEFHWLLQNFQFSWTVTSWFERKPMHSDLFSKWNQLKLKKRTIWSWSQINWFEEDIKWFWQGVDCLGGITGFGEDTNWFWQENDKKTFGQEPIHCQVVLTKNHWQETNWLWMEIPWVWKEFEITSF